MEIQKLNPLVVQMVGDIQALRPSIGLEMGVNMANSLMANIATQMRVTLDTDSGYKPCPCNLYSLTLSTSGSGKNSGLSLLTNFYMKDAFDYIDKSVYPKFKEKALEKLEKDGIERQITSWVPTLGNATPSGLLSYAESYQLVGMSSINLFIDEIGTALVAKAEVFEITLGCYDEGNFPPSAKRSDSNAMHIESMPVNLYSQGNKVKLFNGDNIENAFMRMLEEGGGRRTIFVDDNSVPEVREPSDIVREMKLSKETLKKRSKDREYIKTLIDAKNLKKNIVFDEDALLLYCTIQSDGEKFVASNKGLEQAVISDMLNRNFKTAKLSCIYAFFDRSDVITGKHMEQAFEVIKSSTDVLIELTKQRPLHQRLLESMLLEGNPVTSQHLLSYSFIPKSYTKKVLEYVDLAKELASELGYVWKESLSKGVTYYQVSKPSKKEVEVFDKVDKKEAKELSDRQKELALML